MYTGGEPSLSGVDFKIRTNFEDALEPADVDEDRYGFREVLLSSEFPEGSGWFREFEEDG